VVHCTADEKGKCHVIACPKVTSFGTVEAHVTLRLTGELEPKAGSPPGLNVYDK